MEIGMTIPSMLAGLDRETVLSWARGIDSGPYSTLAVGERIAYPNIEMFTTLAAAAAVTERVRIMSTVVVLPAHAALKVAKMAATIDLLSGGRFVLGVGVGGRDEDYRALERPFARRHQTLDEQVALLRRAWAGEAPGPDLHPVGPTPVQLGGPPIYAGAMGPKAIARAARWAAGISGFLLDPLGEDVGSTLAAIDRAWAEAGRTDRPRHVTSFWYSLAPDGADVLRAYAERYLGIFGPELAAAMAASCSAWSAERVRDALVRLAEAGFDEVLLVPTEADPRELDRVADVVADLTV